MRGVVGGVGGTSLKLAGRLTCTGGTHPASPELDAPVFHVGGVEGGGGGALLPGGGAGGAPCCVK